MHERHHKLVKEKNANNLLKEYKKIELTLCCEAVYQGNALNLLEHLREAIFMNNHYF
jgi:hypothetical protein